MWPCCAQRTCCSMIHSPLHVLQPLHRKGDIHAEADGGWGSSWGLQLLVKPRLPAREPCLAASTLSEHYLAHVALLRNLDVLAAQHCCWLILCQRGFGENAETASVCIAFLLMHAFDGQSCEQCPHRLQPACAAVRAHPSACTLSSVWRLCNRPGICGDMLAMETQLGARHWATSFQRAAEEVLGCTACRGGGQYASRRAAMQRRCLDAVHVLAVSNGTIE